MKFKDNDGFKKNARFILIDFNGEYSDTDIVQGEKDNIIIDEDFKKIINLSSKIKDKYVIEKKSIENVEILSILLDASEKMQVPFLKRSLDSKRLNFTDKMGINIFIFYKFINEIIKRKEKDFGINLILNFFDDLYNVVINKEKIYKIKEFVQTELSQNSTSGSFFSNTVKANQSKSVFSGNSNKPEYESINITRYFINPLKRLMHELEYNLNTINLIRLKIILKYYLEILNRQINKEFITGLISRTQTRFNEIDNLLEISDTPIQIEKFFTIISLKDINNSAIKKVLPLIICKELYDKQKESNSKTKYINFIIDEAHNVLSHSSNRENEQWKDYRLETFEEIIKEGRKFGVFLTIASQRPYDISSTIISQLHNYFLHRLINNNDIQAIEKTISYLDKISFESLPILPTGTCIFAGISAQVPIVLEIDEIEEENCPKNQTIKPTNTYEIS